MTLSELVKKAKELEQDHGSDTNVEFIIRHDGWSFDEDDYHAQSIGSSKEFDCTYTGKKYINIFLR